MKVLDQIVFYLTGWLIGKHIRKFYLSTIYYILIYWYYKLTKAQCDICKTKHIHGDNPLSRIYICENCEYDIACKHDISKLMIYLHAEGYNE